MQNREFDKRVKELMDGHLEVPDSDSWNRLELALIRKRARVVYFRRGVYTSVAVAASLLLLLVLGKQSPVPASLDNIGNLNRLVENVPKPKIEEKITEVKISKIMIAQNAQKNNAQKNNAQNNAKVNNAKVKTGQASEQEKGNIQVAEGVKVAGKQVEKRDDRSKNSDKSVAENKGQLYEFEEEPVGKKRFTKGLLYAFSTNLSPSLYNKSISMLSVSLGYQNDFVPMNLKETIPQQSMSNSRYAMPLSFGFQAQLPVNDKLSVGAGLSYSLLVSQYQNIEYNNRQDVQQSLHYVGIPVNAYYSLLRTKQLNIYLAAGMALEKAIVANYRIVENGKKSNENHSISGVQFSVSGGLGAELMLNKELGLYFDPSLAYYFKCNQPENIRTAQQLQYKVELGMRFHM